MLFKNFLIVSALLISSNSFALSLGKIQRDQSGEVIGVTQREALSVCSKQSLRAPTAKQLAQILANKANSEELKNAAYWSSEKGTLLMGDFGFIADGYDWSDLTAGVICL